MTVVCQGFEIQMMKEREAHAHEKQELRQEIERLRSHLALPPASNNPDDEKLA